MMNLWTFLRTLTVAQVISAADGSYELQVYSSSHTKQFLDLVQNPPNQPQNVCGLIPPEGELKKPICKLGEGCDVLLRCHNYSNSPKLRTGKTVKVTPIELEKIIENPSINNTCAVVMFYVPYCPYSTEFGRTYNALGRSYSELPVLAVDFSENDP